MDTPVWNRVMEEAELRGKGRAQQWLVDQLTSVSTDKPYTLQRVQNWKTRDIPKGEYPAVALALGKTIDWVAGVEVTERVPGQVATKQVTVEHLAVIRDFLTLDLDRQQEIAAAICRESAAKRASMTVAAPAQKPASPAPGSFQERMKDGKRNRPPSRKSLDARGKNKVAAPKRNAKKL